MSKQLSRGTKRICQSETCALPFYDLNRTDIWCPNCGTVFDTSVVLHPRRDQILTKPWKIGGRSSHAVPAAGTAEPKPLMRPDQDEEAASATDDVIDADADTLPLEDDVDHEIGDVVIAPVDDQADR
jgi:uncharacterized protein (TIGR02300 family)